jgi:hypothetical protein
VSDKKKVDTTGLSLRRKPIPPADDMEPLPPTNHSVSAGPIDRVIELAFNPTREKIREVTIIDRMQGRLFPVMDTSNSLFLECIKIALYRQSPKLYRETFREDKPAPVFDIEGELLYRTAQWQKSVAGKNLERATDIALAETETRGPDDDDQRFGGSSGYED